MPDVTRSPWFAAFAGGAAVAVLVVAGVAVLLLPAIQRVDATLTAVEDVLPLVRGIRPEVDRIDRNVETVTPQIGQFRGEIAELEESLATITDPVERLEARIAALQATVEPINTLPELQQQLTDISGSMRVIQSDFTAVRDVLGQLLKAINGLAADFEDVVVLLDKTADHVENIDRKTGPVVPPTGPEERDPSSRSAD